MTILRMPFIHPIPVYLSWVTGNIPTKGGGGSATIFKVDLDGNILWKKAYGGKHSLFPASIVYNPYRKTCIIGGQRDLKTLSGLWNRAYFFEIDSDGNQLSQKDIIFDNDSVDAKTSNLRITKVGVFRDSSIAAILECNHENGNYLMKFNSKLDTICKRQLLVPSLTSGGIGKDIYFKDNEMLMTVGGDDSSDNSRNSWFARLDSVGNITQRWLLEEEGHQDPNFGPGIFYPTNDSGYIFGTHLYKYDKNLKREWSKKILDDPFYLRLYSIIQLKNGAYAGVGESDYHSNGKYLELYFMQTHPNGGFVGLSTLQKTKEGVSISIYPNPSVSGVFTINKQSPQSVKAEIIDASGKKVLQTTLDGSTLDLSAYPAGLYYIRLTDNNGVLLHRQSITNLAQ